MTSLGLIARRTIAASIAYYALDVSLVSDTEFDQWCLRLHDEWDDLDPYLGWKLGSAADVRASGYHIKCTQRDVFGAVSWLQSRGLYRCRLKSDPRKWVNIPKSIQSLEGASKTPAKRVKGDFMSGRFTTVDNFGWNEKETIQ